MNTIKRKCQSCNLIQDRCAMIKITRTLSGLVINPNSKILGRSMYVCKNLECIKNLIKKKRIKNALKFYNLDIIKKTEDELLEIVENQS